SLSQIKLSPFRFYGDPQRDPRFHCISCVFAGYATPSEVNPKAEDDAADVRWWPLNQLPPLAFDHELILRDFLTQVS
ncbi:MAG: NUDIX hydrolase, partial [Verrucomicrobiota bacterium JB023]|nr:NUDIX hydrolase [Verrucomicrobiota bacterium JB023]